MSALADAIVADLTAGIAPGVIAARHACHPGYVRKVRQRRGLADRGGPKPHVDDAVAAITEIATRWGVDPRTVVASAHSRIFARRSA